MQLEEQIEILVQPILDDLDLELVDLVFQRESRGWILRFFLDKEGGINLDHCAEASREISTLLDVEDIIEVAYTLEVSSPGIERPLKKPAHFERFSGELVKIKTRIGLDPDQRGTTRKTFVGILKGVSGSDIILQLQDKGSVEVKIPLAEIDSANLKYEF